MIRNDIPYHKNVIKHPYLRVILPGDLDFRVIGYMHTLIGHQVTDKCMPQISQSLDLKKLDQKGEEACFAIRHLSES
jgi:hypothetical protein